MTTQKIPSMPSPLPKRIVQPNALFAAELDMQLSQQTEALAFRCLGNHLAYIDPFYNQPFQAIDRIATIAAVATWASFVATDTATSGQTDNMQWPFRQTEGYGGIGIIGTFVSNSNALFAVRFQLKTLAGHTMTTATSQVAYMSGGAVPADVPTLIQGGSLQGKYVMSVHTSIDTPTLDSTRRFVVEPQVQAADTQNQIISAGFSVLVHMRNLLIYENLPGTVGI